MKKIYQNILAVFLVGLASPGLDVSASKPDDLSWYSSADTSDSSLFSHHYSFFKKYIDVKEVEGQGLCLQYTSGHGQLCQKAHKLGESVQIRNGGLIFNQYNESFGDVNFNFINSQRYREHQNITVIQQDEQWSNVFEQSFEASVDFGDFGKLNDGSSTSSMKSKVVITQEIDYIFVSEKQLDSIKSYINKHIFDFWNNSTRFDTYTLESEMYSPQILRLNGSCEGLSKKLPPLDLTFFVYPTDYFYKGDSDVVQQKKVRIHSRYLLREQDGFCVFGIASSDVQKQSQRIIIGQPLLKGHHVIFVHDLPPAAIIQPKRGEQFEDKDDGDNFVSPFNPYDRPSNFKPHERSHNIYDSYIDEILMDTGLDATFIGSIWHLIEKNNKSQITVMVIGFTGAFIIAVTLSFSWVAIVLEIIAYLYSQNAI